MRPRSAALAVMLLLVPLGLGLAPATGSHADEPAPSPAPALGDFAVGDTASSMYWETTATGHRHVRMSFDFGTLQQCTFVYTLGGQTAAGRPHFAYVGHDAPGKQWGAVAYRDLAGAPYTTHVHVGQLAITDFEANGQWFVTMAFSTLVSGDEAWLVSGYNLRPTPAIPQSNGQSLSIDIDCDHSFEVTGLEAGTGGFTFDPPKLRGGVGASSGTTIDLSVNVLDRRDGSFQTGDVYYRYRGDSSPTFGTLEVFHPAGDQSFFLSGGDEVFLEGAAGAWNTRFTRSTYGEGQEAIGVVVALQPVASLDAAAAL